MIDTPGGEHRNALAAAAVVVDPDGTRRPLSEVLAELVGGEAQPVAWDDITGRPATYPPAAHTHTAAQVSDATATGRSVLTAADAAAARTAIGAGTSSVVVGTGAADAAAGTHTHTAATVTATEVGGGTATTVQGILAELAARITDLEGDA
ncbi:hypothetical protein OG909_12220 [Streptomyces sp. NBC_01754]|uniref:hypothetical protein n=1 Tax=Streptomyces sp. NBC_01754 TaxID=2975930 RepID=UPI002DDB21E8|nr:hypothetical protein [Streptomyces sp. NBC_01754]WSC93000.1 hypothetical protein OG909_12220 [Streptomyces sp. NBC_01754]